MKPSKKQMRAVENFRIEMNTVTIPKIVKDIARRQVLAQKSRNWIIGG